MSHADDLADMGGVFDLVQQEVRDIARAPCGK
jgi:hypothetical protein